MVKTKGEQAFGSVTLSKCSVQLWLAWSTSWPTLASRHELSIAGRAVIFGHTYLLSEVTNRSLWIQPSHRILSSWIPIISDTFYNSTGESLSLQCCITLCWHTAAKVFFQGWLSVLYFFELKCQKKKKKPLNCSITNAEVCRQFVLLHC